MLAAILINLIGLAMVALTLLAKHEQHEATRRLIKLGGSVPDAQVPATRPTRPSPG